jgi:DNA segregation ATPase FtsK/SpoIIIE, S-DNA-T family
LFIFQGSPACTVFHRVEYYLCFMANKLKKSTIPKAAAEKPGKKENPVKARPVAAEQLKKDREEKVDIKQLAKDERTLKIIGTSSLLISVFLFIAFASYLFTWREDQSQVLNRGLSFLFDNDKGNTVANLLGRLGAYVSHNIIFNGFGLASFLFCTFFFVLGVNLLFERKVFSVTRNLKYVTIGLVIASVVFAFVLPGGADSFPYGGHVGNMISDWFINFLGTIGTAVLLLVVAFSYLIWQFNPSFSWPERKNLEAAPVPLLNDGEEPLIIANEDEIINGAFGATTINDLYTGKQNELHGGGGMVLTIENPDVLDNGFSIIEKGEAAAEEEEVDPGTDAAGDDINDDILHQDEHSIAVPIMMEPANVTKAAALPGDIQVELEIKTPDPLPEEEKTQKDYSDLPPYEPTLDLRDYKYPGLDLLNTHGSEKIVQDPAELEANKNQILTTLRNYDITIQKISATVGPTVTLYEIVPAPGVRISRIKNLEDDIALSLAALGIRIIAPIPGKGTIGIEVPNVKKSIVSMKNLLASEKFIHNNYSLPIAIGKRIDNENFIVDLASMPHLLMAGATGQGKSVGVNAVLVSLLYKKHPSQLKFILIDPKKVELSIYRTIEKHFLAKLPGEDEAIITDTKKVINTLNALCIEMDNRYDLLKEAGARNIKEYNEKFIKRRLNPQKGHQFLPFIVLVIDEFADLIMTAGKEIEMPIARLAQLARAVGIHLIIATQRPSVNIITGTIKANFPSRVAFKVSSKIDSRTILDAGGAEQLIGKGDMLISHNGEITRLQCAFVDTPEVEKVVDFISDQRGYPQAFLLPEYVDEKELESREFDMGERDAMFEEAAHLIVQNQVGSTSLLQRRMKLGYNRAGRLMDQLEVAGIVGPNLGSKAREVLIKTEAELVEVLQTLS